MANVALAQSQVLPRGCLLPAACSRTNTNGSGPLWMMCGFLAMPLDSKKRTYPGKDELRKLPVAGPRCCDGRVEGKNIGLQAILCPRRKCGGAGGNPVMSLGGSQRA